jgi:hypothetical protein
MAATLSPERFERITFTLVSGFLARYAVGTEWSFGLTEAFDVKVWVPRAGHLTLQVVDWTRDFDAPIRTVTVAPGEHKAFAAIASTRDGVLILDETRGLPAAFSTALEYLAAPAHAALQHEHDPVAV